MTLVISLFANLSWSIYAIFSSHTSDDMGFPGITLSPFGPKIFGGCGISI